MRKFNAFTLAEVLITLGIIGVVAAMTMPTLINQTNGAQYKAAYKKALSAIAQGITLNVALDDKSFADTTAVSTTTNAAPAESIAAFLKDRMNVVNLTMTLPTGYTLPTGIKADSITLTCDEAAIADDANTNCATGEKGKEYTVSGSTITPGVYLFFNDSSMFAYEASSKGCTTGNMCKGIIDVNGAKGPNKLVTDGNKPTDIYPVVFYDQTIRPASDAASAVLYGK